MFGLWNQNAIHTDFSDFFRAAESRQLSPVPHFFCMTLPTHACMCLHAKIFTCAWVINVQNGGGGGGARTVQLSTLPHFPPRKSLACCTLCLAGRKKNSTRKETVNKIIDFPSHLRHLSPSIIEANIPEACLV